MPTPLRVKKLIRKTKFQLRVIVKRFFLNTGKNYLLYHTTAHHAKIFATGACVIRVLIKNQNKPDTSLSHCGSREAAPLES